MRPTRKLAPTSRSHNRSGDESVLRGLRPPDDPVAGYDIGLRSWSAISRLKDGSGKTDAARGGGRAGGAEVGRVEDRVRERRGREKPGRTTTITTAVRQDARQERSGCQGRRRQAPDRPAVPHRLDSPQQARTARTRNDGDVHTRAEASDRRPMIIPALARHY